MQLCIEKNVIRLIKLPSILATPSLVLVRYFSFVYSALWHEQYNCCKEGLHWANVYKFHSPWLVVISRLSEECTWSAVVSHWWFLVPRPLAILMTCAQPQHRVMVLKMEAMDKEIQKEMKGTARNLSLSQERCQAIWVIKAWMSRNSEVMDATCFEIDQKANFTKFLSRTKLSQSNRAKPGKLVD